MMARHIMRCPDCMNYTMKEKCSCGAATIMPRPAKYSPDDKYSEYRRMAKREQHEKEGFI